MTNEKFQGVCWNIGMSVQRDSPGTDRPLWYHLDIKSYNVLILEYSNHVTVRNIELVAAICA